MPSATHVDTQPTGITKFTNCLLVKGNSLIKEDLWISSVSGKILNGQQLLYGHRTAPDNIVDLGGRILSPGFIDVQLNGAYGFDFSVIPEDGTVGYGKGVRRVNKNLITTGVTSYLPTLTSQRPEVYQKVRIYTLNLHTKLRNIDPLTFLGSTLLRSLWLIPRPKSGL
jgi:N-acetylglucosamine-6-phosphate deacetylase